MNLNILDQFWVKFINYKKLSRVIVWLLLSHCFLLFGLMSSSAYAQSQNEVQISVLFDGASDFTAGEPTAATGTAPEPHTPGSDGGPQNLVVRTNDQFAVRVDWNINEDLATGATLTTQLPLFAEWTTDDTGGYSGCATTTFPDPQTAVCVVGDQAEGSNGTIRMTALLNTSTDNTVFDIPTTLTTGEDTGGVTDSLDQFLTVSETPIANFLKGPAEVAGTIDAPIISGGESGLVFLYPLSLIDFSQGADPILGAGPINSALPIDFFDHAYMLSANAALATAQQMIDAGVGFAGRPVCGAYDGAGAFPITVGTWTCGTPTNPNGYPVVPINVTGHDASQAPALNADGSDNVVGSGVNVLTGQIAFWVPADEAQDEISDPLNDSAISAFFENAIASQDDATEITEQTDVAPIQVPGSSGFVDELATASDPADDPSENASRTILGSSPTGVGVGPGATIGHNISFRGGPLQLLETTLYGPEPRFGLDFRTIANGGLRGLLPGEAVDPGTSNGDDIGETPRGNIVTIHSQVLTLSTSTESPYDAPIQGCTAFDTSHYQLTGFGQIPITQTDGTGPGVNPTVIGGTSVSSNTGPLAHVYTGLARATRADVGGQFIAVGGTRAGIPFTVEFTDAPLQLLPGGNFGVLNDQLTCNDDDAGPSGWIDATEAAALTAAFDQNGDGNFEGITRARVRITERFPWALGPGPGLNDLTTGFAAYFQARVLSDLAVQTVNQELFALQSHSFGDLGPNGVPDGIPFIGGTVPDVAGLPNQCVPYSNPQWQATGNDLQTTTGYCNNTFEDDGANSFDTNDLVDWDNNSTTQTTLTNSGVLRVFNASGAVISIVEANLALSKTNNDGLGDIADNGDSVFFTLRPSVVGSSLEALTNVRLTDNLPPNYNFVNFVSGPSTPGATCNPPSTPDGTITCQFSEPNPAVDTGPLPSGLPGGWSDEVVIEVVVVGAVADPVTPTVISNTATVLSTGLGPWDPVAEDFIDVTQVVNAPRSRASRASSFLPLPADEGVIVKVVNELEGECEVAPQEFLDEGGTLAEWQERCSMVVANEELSFDLSVTNEGNTAFTRLEFIDVFPHLADATEEVSDTSAAQLGSSRPPTVGDGRFPASNFAGDVSFVSLAADSIPAGSSLAAVWVTGDAPLTVSRDPNLALNATTWCDAVAGAVVSGPAGACPATPEDVTAVYGLIDGGAGLLPGETATLNLTLDSIDTGCEDLWTNTFGLRVDEIFLPIRSNDVSVMVTGCDLADLEDTFSTLIASGGPVHPIRDGLALGAVVDAELDGQIGSVRALGDDDNFSGDTGIADDEDALQNVPGSALITGQAPLTVADVNGVPTSTYTLNIPVVNTTGADAFVVGYIDFNGDGDFDTGEASAPATVSTSGTAALVFSVSGIASGTTGVRLRLSSVLDDVITPLGFATDGEVEDHLIEILPVVRTEKVLVPANAPDTFTLTAGTATATGGSGTATAFVPFSQGVVSPITISEAVATGTNGFITSAVCTDANGSAVSAPSNGLLSFDTSIITLNGNTTAESTITCTFTNTQQSTVAVVKTATPADGTNFTFSSTRELVGDPGSATIPAGDFDLDGELVDSDSDLLINQIAATGSFTVTESVTFSEQPPQGWMLNSVSCTEADTTNTPTLNSPIIGSVEADGSSGEVTVTIDPGDTITCTFDNIQLVSLGSALWIDTDGDGVLDEDEPPIVGAVVNLLNPDGSPVLDSNGDPITTTTDANGNYFFNDLLPGDYIVQVVVDPSLSPTPNQVSDPDDDVNNDSNVDVASPFNDPAAGVFTSGVISLTPGTEPTGELAADATDDQPGQTGIADDAGNMTLDFGFIPEPQIGVSKAAGVPTLNTDGTFDVVYTLLLENTGAVDISSISLSDDLASQFGAAFFTASDATDPSGGIVVAPVVTPAVDASGTAIILPTGNAAYTGDAAGIDLFTADSSTLGVGDSVQVTFTVRFNPAVAGQTLNNTATASGADPAGRLAEDLSDNGADAMTNAGGPGTPTPVTFPEPDSSLVVSKEVATIPIDLGNGQFQVTFNFVVENDGQVDISDLQIVDDLLAALNNPTPNGGTVDSALVAFVAGDVLTPNPAFDGVVDTNMLAGTDPFPVGASSELTVTMVFTPDTFLGPYNNNAVASGTDPSGVSVADDSESAASPTAGADVASDTLFSVAIPTVPISLGSFSSTVVDGAVVFTWVTQTEVANVGFHLYGRVDDEWIQLNNEIILSQGDSVSLQNYEFSALTDARIFSLSDVDLEGVETLHGPFNLGAAHGTIGERRGIDWQGEKAEREAKAEQRKVRREARQRERTERKLERLKLRQSQTKEAQRDSADNETENEETSMMINLQRSLIESFNGLVVASLSVLIPSAHAQEVVDWVNLATTEDGVHEVSYETLAQFGVDLDGLQSADLSMVNQGVNVPVQVLGGDVFTQGSSLRFIAKPIDTLYTDQNIYTLRSGAGAVDKINSVATELPAGAFAISYLSSAKFAPQARYSFTSPDADDPWYATRLVSVNQAVSETVQVQLDDIAVGGNTGSTQAKMSVNVWGGSNLPGLNDHRMQVSFNGQQLMDDTFEGLDAKSFEMNLSEVREGSNQVTLTLPTQEGFGLDVVNVNEVEVQYPRQFVAQDNRLVFTSRLNKFLVRGFSANAIDENGRPSLDVVVLREDQNGQVEQISNAEPDCRRDCSVTFAGTGEVATYYVSANDHQVALQAALEEQDINSGLASYLIISHPDFIGEAGNNQLEALAQELTEQLGSADVVDVEQIYAQYSGHVFDPTAIQRYIQFANANRGTQYVLLVGGDVYDYRQFENEDATSFIPSLYAATGKSITFAPVDAKYADVNDDNVPDLSIGRLPVRTTAQLTALMNKRASYLSRDYAGTALLVADEFDVVQQYDFTSDAQSVADDFLGNFQLRTAYVDDLGSKNARTVLTNEINQGTTLTAFFGHSSTNQWSFNGLLTGNDAASLTNVGRPTVVTQWGCWNAYYVSPNEDSMGHRFMMEGEQGAVAVMGATTLTNANSERVLARLVFARLANGERIGDAVTNAKQEYAQTNPNDLDVLLGWTLLGMPDLFVN